MTEDSDEALMRGIAAGDETALRALAERHLERMRRLARKTLGGEAEADDVTQEALIRVWTHAASWRPEQSQLSTWLYTIVWRLCVDRLRASHTVPLELAMQAEDPAPGAFDTLAQACDLGRLAAAMGALQPRQRAALTLFYYEEMAGPDAAQVLGMSLRAFWSLLHRARQSVKEHMISPSPGKP